MEASLDTVWEVPILLAAGVDERICGSEVNGEVAVSPREGGGSGLRMTVSVQVED